MEGKHQRVSETIGMKELGRGKCQIVLADSQDAPRIVLTTVLPIVVAVHGSLRHSGAAGGPQPKVSALASAARIELWRRIGNPVLPSDMRADPRSNDDRVQ